MPMCVQEERIVPTVIMAFELQKLGSAGVRTSQAQCEHGCLAAGVGKSNRFCRRYHTTETFRGFDFRGCRGCKM